MPSTCVTAVATPRPPRPPSRFALAMIVPGAGLYVLRTQTGTPASIANSMAGACTTFAPAFAIWKSSS